MSTFLIFVFDGKLSFAKCLDRNRLAILNNIRFSRVKFTSALHRRVKSCRCVAVEIKILKKKMLFFLSEIDDDIRSCV